MHVLTHRLEGLCDDFLGQRARFFLYTVTHNTAVVDVEGHGGKRAFIVMSDCTAKAAGQYGLRVRQIQQLRKFRFVRRIGSSEEESTDDALPIATPANISRYQYGNHLGTVGLELDETGQLISYEEFHPYGTTAYRAANSAIEVSPSRYRYTGKERDEETGLDHMGARNYAPWLGLWTAADPIGLGDGVNRYAYVSGRPISMSDPSGTMSTEPQTLNKALEEMAVDAFERHSPPAPNAFEGVKRPSEVESLPSGTFVPSNEVLRADNIAIAPHWTGTSENPEGVAYWMVTDTETGLALGYFGPSREDIEGFFAVADLWLYAGGERPFETESFSFQLHPDMDTLGDAWVLASQDPSWWFEVGTATAAPYIGGAARWGGPTNRSYNGRSPRFQVAIAAADSLEWVLNRK